MNVIPTPIKDLLVIEPNVFVDNRGFFMETYALEQYRAIGIGVNFLQDNLSYSHRGVLRGLHFQNPKSQGKLLYVLQGEVYDVAVDIRRSSATFGNWFGIILSGENKRQFWVPPGFAHGFCVTSETVLFSYKCSDYYSPENEHVIRYDDPDIGIQWPNQSPLLSIKDSRAPRLSAMDASILFF